MGVRDHYLAPIIYFKGITVEGIKICGVSEKVLEEARARQARWVNKKELNWYLADRLPGMALEVYVAAIHNCFQNWQAVCGLVFKQTTDAAKADFMVRVRRIDGGSGILAEHELPMGGNQTLNGWFDSSERWVVSGTPGQSIDLIAVGTHEFGHGIGLSHTNIPQNLLNPIYTPRIRTPQAWDIQEAQNRYGPAIAEPEPPKEDPSGNNFLIPTEILAKIGGQPYLYVLKK